MDDSLEGGFADPVHQSQQVFRAILDALANPGTLRDLPLADVAHRHLAPELVSGLLTLTDHDTPIWLAQCYRRDEVADFVAFHTGAPIVEDPAAAQFAFASAGDDLPALNRFNPGTQDYPDRSTTVLLAVPALTEGPRLMLAGPGIKDRAVIAPQGLRSDFAAQWAANWALFPRGIDLLLMAQGQVLGLPRSSRIVEA